MSPMNLICNYFLYYHKILHNNIRVLSLNNSANKFPSKKVYKMDVEDRSKRHKKEEEEEEEITILDIRLRDPLRDIIIKKYLSNGERFPLLFVSKYFKTITSIMTYDCQDLIDSLLKLENELESDDLIERDDYIESVDLIEVHRLIAIHWDTHSDPLTDKLQLITKSTTKNLIIWYHQNFNSFRLDCSKPVILCDDYFVRIADHNSGLYM